MELGEKIREARVEMGLSQRELCGEEITRNMLSLIENGAAKPSMKTLQYLAGRLGKSVSYFLEEKAAVSPNQEAMEAARRLYGEGNYAEAAKALAEYKGPDPIYDPEKGILWVLTHLALGEEAIAQGREIYARELLEKANIKTAYCAEELEKRRLLLLGSLRGQRVAKRLPGLDEELLLRGREALAEGDFSRAARWLDAAEDQAAPRWCLIRGEVWLAQKKYKNAARCFHGAEKALPGETAERLEICYRELGDFKKAYEYACRQKG